jgi:hypothetical protein
MNELDVLKELRASLPEPSAATMAAGRASLAAAIQANSAPTVARPHRRHARPHAAPAIPRAVNRRRAATACVLAALTATAAVIAVSVSNAGPQAPRSHHHAASGPPIKAQLAAKVLQRAAAAVTRNQATEPSGGQWFYSKTVDYEVGGKPPTTADQEWGTFDGRYTAYHAGGQLIVHANPGPITGRGATALDRFDDTATPRTAYQALASLPANPAALLAVISAHVATLNPGQVLSPIQQYAPRSSSQVTFSYLVDLMWNASDGQPPAAQASVYRAMARMPGVIVQRNVTDAAGQVTIGVSDNGGIDQLLLDPRTYAVVGIREVSTGVSPIYVASKAQMIRRRLAGLKGRQLAEMKAELRKYGTRMWRIAKERDALPWPRKGAVLESLAISELRPVSGPGRH